MKTRDPVLSTPKRLPDPRRVLGANDRIGLGVIGCGKRGRGLVANCSKIPGAELVAVSDVYVPRTEQAASMAGQAARTCTDYREILDRNDIDAVVIATPDHWHVPMTLQAVEAGKDVYLEKPVTHNIEEGSVLLAAVERSGRVVATGTQQRSWEHFVEAKRLIDDGALGRITFARCHWYQNHLQGERDKRVQIDLGLLDWDQWLGPAPRQAFDSARFRHWRFFWDFGGGSVTDLMTHWIDVIQWYMDSSEASEVGAVGCSFVHDWFQTPDTVAATMLYPEGFVVTFEGNLTIGLLGCGIVFRGEKAMMTLDRSSFAIYEEGTTPFESSGLPNPARRFVRHESGSLADRIDGAGTLANLSNWLSCIREGSEPNAHIRAGVQAAATAHRVNEVVRAGNAAEMA